MLLEDADRVRAQSDDYALKQKLIQSTASLIQGPAQALFYQMFGPVGAGAAVLSFIGLAFMGNKLNTNAQHNLLTNSYRDELAKMLGKDRGEVTDADFDDVARNAPQDNPLRRDYEITNATAVAGQTKSLVKNLLIGVSIITFAALGSGLALSPIGFGIMSAISFSIDMLAENTLGKWQASQPPVSAIYINKIQSEMSRGMVTPLRLMAYTAQIDPKISQTIRDTYNADYNTLSFKQKHEAITMLGQQKFLTTLANDLNNGTIRASELPFLLSGQNSPTTKLTHYHNIPEKPVFNDEASQIMQTTIPAAQISAAEPQGHVQETELTHTLH